LKKGFNKIEVSNFKRSLKWQIKVRIKRRKATRGKRRRRVRSRS
jgi:hypothetical protein